jgi:hypothetical protein
MGGDGVKATENKKNFGPVTYFAVQYRHGVTVFHARIHVSYA